MVFLTVFRIVNCQLVSLPFFDEENPTVLVPQLSITSTRAAFMRAFIWLARRVFLNKGIPRDNSYAPYEVLVTIRDKGDAGSAVTGEENEYRFVLPALE